MALAALSGDLRTSSSTQAKGRRSCSPWIESVGAGLIASIVDVDSSLVACIKQSHRVDQWERPCQAILKRATDWRSSSAMCESSRTCWPLRAVPSPVCSVTVKIAECCRPPVGQLRLTQMQKRNLFNQLSQSA